MDLRNPKLKTRDKDNFSGSLQEIKRIFTRSLKKKNQLKSAADKAIYKDACRWDTRRSSHWGDPQHEIKKSF